jgi:CubicO group peptidase (beta-lactamase class C family)
LALLFIAIFYDKSELPANEEKPIVEEIIEKKINKAHLAKAKELDKYFTRRHEKIGFNGTVLFAEDGQVVYENSFGYADIRKKIENKIDTKFQIASATKPFTTYAIMLLKQKGELSYEDSVQQYFPEFPYKGISIRLLMIHKSGLPEYFYFADKLWKDRQTPITNKDVINLMIEHHPQRYYLPDKKYNYINTNYCILAAIVEKITGKTFEDFMMENVFVPLEMNDTFIYNKAHQKEVENVAIGYTRRRRVAEDTYLNGVVGDKGIYTTVEDMLKFDQALFNGNPVRSEILEEAFKPAHKRLYIHDNYGFGWRINASDSTNKIVYHTGWWKGFRSYFIRQLGTRKTIIVLSNMSNQSVFGTRELIKLFD